MNDTIAGLAGNDNIDGGDGSDRIDAGAGDDTVDGSDGDDTIVGGGGADQFIFTGEGSNGDTESVTAFNVGQSDVFALTSSVYSGAPPVGTTALVTNAADAVDQANNIIVDTSANIAEVSLGNNRFAYATDTGELLFDSDGNWADGRGTIAEITTLNGTLVNASFAFV